MLDTAAIGFPALGSLIASSPKAPLMSVSNLDQSPFCCAWIKACCKSPGFAPADTAFNPSLSRSGWESVDMYGLPEEVTTPPLPLLPPPPPPPSTAATKVYFDDQYNIFTYLRNIHFLIFYF